MTAPVLRGTSISESGSRSSHTLTIPAGAQVGDWVYIWTSHNQSTDTAHQRMPAGWTAVDRVVYSSSFCSEHWSRQVVAGGAGTAGGAGSTVTITFGGAARRAFFLACYNLPVEARASMTAPGTTTTNTAPTVVTVADDSTALEVWCERSSTASTSVTQPSGFTTLASVFNSGSGSASIAAADNTSATNPGDTVGGGTWTADVANPGVIIWTVAVEGSVSASTVNLTPASVTVTAVVLQPVGQVNLTPATVALTARPIYPTAVVNLTPATVAVAARPVAFLTPVQMLPARIILAHRGGPSVPNNGGSGPRPQNTLAALLKMATYDHPKTIYECDLAWLAAGGGATDEQRMALTHAGDNLAEDNNVFNDSGGAVQTTGAAASLTYAQWKTKWIKTDSSITPAAYAAATSWDEIADWLQANPTRVAAPEVKDPSTLSPLVASVSARGLVGQVIAQSFTYSECVTMAAAGLNVSWNTNTLTSTTAGNAYAAGIRYVGVDRTIGNLAGYCTTAAAAGLEVLVYTVNSSTNRDVAFAAGARGIFTNRPDILNNLGGADLINGAVTVSAVALTPVPQPVTVSLAPATVALSARPTTPAPQPVGVTLTPASVALSALSTTPVPQAVTVSLSLAVVTSSAVAVSPVPQPVTVTLSSAALAVSAGSVSPAGGPSIVSLSPAAVAAAARPLTATPGAVTVALTPASVTVTTVAVSPQPMAVSVTLTPASVTVTAVSVSPASQSGTVTLTAAALSLLSRPLSPSPGVVGVTLVSASVALTARPLSAGGPVGPVVPRILFAVLRDENYRARLR